MTRNTLVLVAAVLPSIAIACGSKQRVFVVERVDHETVLAADSCPTVVSALGEAGANRLLVGHLLRPGQRVALGVREWHDGRELPARRITLFLQPADGMQFVLPSSRVDLHADRVSADGKTVKELTVVGGILWFTRTSNRLWRVHLEMKFEGDEPALYIDEKVGWRSLDNSGPGEGRANPLATPEDYINP